LDPQQPQNNNGPVDASQLKISGAKGTVAFRISRLQNVTATTLTPSPFFPFLVTPGTSFANAIAKLELSN
jgi:hypothetical protein